jgi:heme exporter protein A
VSESPAILLRRLSRDFGERPALEGVDLELPSGSTLAVLGPNGSGKSTLLRILAGLLRPSRGEAEVLGNELPKEAWRLRGRIGYLGHGPLLYRDLSARENLVLAAELYGLDRDNVRSRISALLDAAGMTPRADDRVAEYSAGMRQRIDICRAVLHDPALLLLDEPHAHLDVDAQARMEPLIAGQGGRTRVIVSHDPERARAGADHVLELPSP